MTIGNGVFTLALTLWSLCDAWECQSKVEPSWEWALPHRQQRQQPSKAGTSPSRIASVITPRKRRPCSPSAFKHRNFRSQQKNNIAAPLDDYNNRRRTIWIFTSLSVLIPEDAALRKRTRNMYDVGIVKFHSSLFSIPFSIERICSLLYALSDIRMKSLTCEAHKQLEQELEKKKHPNRIGERDRSFLCVPRGPKSPRICKRSAWLKRPQAAVPFAGLVAARDIGRWCTSSSREFRASVQTCGVLQLSNRPR